MPGHSSDNPLTIAIVDDDPSVCSALSSLLRSLGYVVSTHASADAFLTSGDADRCDCVVSDVHMPGTGGIELARQLTRLRPGLPVILMTARAEESWLAQAAACGARALLRKPFDGERLLDEVARALQGP